MLKVNNAIEMLILSWKNELHQLTFFIQQFLVTAKSSYKNLSVLVEKELQEYPDLWRSTNAVFINETVPMTTEFPQGIQTCTASSHVTGRNSTVHIQRR